MKSEGNLGQAQILGHGPIPIVKTSLNIPVNIIYNLIFTGV